MKTVNNKLVFYRFRSQAELGNASYPAKLSLRTVFVLKCNLGTRESNLGTREMSGRAGVLARHGLVSHGA